MPLEKILHCISSVIRFFSLLKQSYKTYLEIKDCFGKRKPLFIAKLHVTDLHICGNIGRISSRHITEEYSNYNMKRWSGKEWSKKYIKYTLIYVTILFIAPNKRGSQLIFFLLLHKNMLLYSLEASHWGASNEYQQHKFSWRNKKKYQYFSVGKNCHIWSYNSYEEMRC